MPFESPISVLYDSNGSEIAVSQSQVVSGLAQPGLMTAGSGSDGRAYFFRVSTEGALFITGSISSTPAATQSVQVADWLAAVTGSMKVAAWGTNVTGAVNLASSASIIVGGWATAVTGNMNLAAWGTNVTGAVNLASSASIIVGGFQANATGNMNLAAWGTNVTGTVNVIPSASLIVGGWAQLTTASVREIGAATTTVSSTIASLTNFTLLSANPARKKATFFKEGTGVAYLKLGATATATSYTVQLSGNGYYETPENYTGRIDVIFSTATATSIIRSTEITTP